MNDEQTAAKEQLQKAIYRLAFYSSAYGFSGSAADDTKCVEARSAVNVAIEALCASFGGAK